MEGAAAKTLSSIVETLNRVSRDCEKEFIESLERVDAELAQEVKKKMFVFEDILLLDDRSIQETLRASEKRDLLLALRNSGQQVVEAITRNMSERAVEELKEETFEIYNYSSPTEEEVEGAKMKVVGTIRELEKRGKIQVSRG